MRTSAREPSADASASSLAWIERQLAVWKLLFAGALVGGLASIALTSEVAATSLAAAVTFFGLLPCAIGIAFAIVVAFPCAREADVAAAVRVWLRSRDAASTAQPVLFVMPLPFVLVGMLGLAQYALRSFRTHELIAWLMAGAAVCAVVFAAGLIAIARPRLMSLSRRVAARETRWLPLASVGSSLAWAGALAAVCLGVVAGVAWEELLAAGLGAAMWLCAELIIFVGVVATALVAGLGHRTAWRRGIDLMAFAGLLAVGAGLFASGSSGPARTKVISAPGYAPAYRWATMLTDTDGDGFSSRLGGSDCDPLDERVYPGARDEPGNDLDENCSGSDYDGTPYRPDPPGYAATSKLCPRGGCNVIFITLDSLRADQLSQLGADQTYMPHLEAKANAGVLFANAYSPGPGTMTTVPCMLAGRFDSTLEMDPKIPRRHPVHRDETLLSDSLQDAGIATHAVLEHRMLDPLNHGWSSFYNPWRPDYASRSTAAFQFERIERVVRQSKHERFFVYAHILETHHDFVLHDEHAQFGRDKLGRYRSELAYVDTWLGRLFDLVETEVVDRPTVFIIAGDHGEGFGEHGIAKHNEGLYRALTWVPLVVWSPGMPVSRRLEAPVSLFDLAPTIRNLFGLPPREAHVGISLVPAIEAGAERRDRTIYNQAIYDEQGRYYNLVGITRGSMRLLHDMRRQTFELYDLTSDPTELIDLSGREPAILSDMKAELVRWLEQIGLSSSFVHRYWELGRASPTR